MATPISSALSEDASSETLKNALKDSDAIAGNGANDGVQRGAALPPVNRRGAAWASCPLSMKKPAQSQEPAASQRAQTPSA